MKTIAERTRESRERKREKGMVPKHIWVYPEDWDEIKAYIEFKNTSREKIISKKS